MKYLNLIKLKFIDKLSNIYQNLSYVNEEAEQGEDIIKSLWRWIKLMIKNKKNQHKNEDKIYVDRV